MRKTVLDLGSTSVWLWRISFLENLTYTTIWGIL